MAITKFPVLERDGVDYFDPIEHALDLEDAKFSSTKTGLTNAEFGQEAIDYAQAISSLEKIDDSLEYFIPENKQMFVHESLVLNGDILVDGTLAIESGQVADDFAHNDLSGIGTDDHHDEDHTIASHTDTTATGAQLNTLVSGADTTLHSHASSAVFGAGYTYNSSEGLSTTTSATFQQKLRLTSGTLVDGAKYLISWRYAWSHSSASVDFRGRVQIDDTTGVMTHQQEPQDTGVDQYNGSSGFYEHTASGTSAINIDLDYCTSSTGNTARISEARLSIWRVE